MKKQIITLLLVFFCLLAVPVSVSAKDLFGGNSSTGQICKGGSSNSEDPNSSAVCQDSRKTTDNPLTGENGLLVNIANIVAFVAGAAAVIVILVGSIRFITAGGDPQKAATARSTITNALIGLVLIVLGRTLIVYVIKRL